MTKSFLPMTKDDKNIDFTVTGWDPTWDDMAATITIDTIDTITVDTIDPSVYTLTGVTNDDTFGDYNFTLNPKEFVDFMPPINKIEGMCNEYPALKQAWDNFRTMYEMVHQDWIDNKDNESPF